MGPLRGNRDTIKHLETRAERLHLSLPGSVLASTRELVVGGRTPPELAIGQAFESWLSQDATTRKKTGSFYTPVSVVDELLSKSLRPLLARRSRDDILKLRIIDPACGPGIFLLRAQRLIESRCIELGFQPGKKLRRQIAEKCLVGIDKNPGAIHAGRLAFDTVAEDTCPQLCIQDALLEPLNIGEDFDLVIGNPPWGQKAIRFTDTEKKQLRSKFAVAKGAFDPFALFVELAIGLLKPQGMWAMVLPDIVLLKNQQPIRDLILDSCEIEEIATLGRVFPSVNLDVVLMVAEKHSAPNPAHRIRISEERRSYKPIAQGTFKKLDGHKFNLFMTDEKLALVERLRSIGTFEDAFECHEGVHTGNARETLFTKTKEIATVPIIVGGKELAPFRLDWAGTYLRNNKSVLAADQYANLGRPEWFKNDKIVVRRTGDRVIAAVDQTGLYVSNNLFVMLPTTKAISPEFLWGAAALLNSNLMTWFYRTVQPRTGKLFAELKLCHLRRFPFPKQLGSILELGACAMNGTSTKGIDLASEDLFDLDSRERSLVANQGNKTL